MVDGFEATLSLGAIGALCSRLGLRAPLPLGGPEVPRAGGPGDVEDVDVALAGLVEQGLARLEGGALVVGENLSGALVVLGDPGILVTALRRGSAPAMTTSIGVHGSRAAELRPVGNGAYRIAAFPPSGAVERAAAFCGLVDRPFREVPGFTLAPERLVRAHERVAAGDVAGAASVLAADGGPAGTHQAFLEALVSSRAACEVTVLDRRHADRVHGTVTAWLDGGDGGLWRVTPGAVPDVGVEVRPVRAAEIVAEIGEGFPELTCA